MQTVRMPHKEDAIETSEVVAWQEDHELADDAHAEARAVCEDGAVPISYDDLDIVFCAFRDHRSFGAASPYGCGEYRAVSGISGGRWEVQRQPDGYVVMLSKTKFWERSDPKAELRNTVRHEIAHICGWEEEKVTYEGRRNHATWLDYLDAK